MDLALMAIRKATWCAAISMLVASSGNGIAASRSLSTSSAAEPHPAAPQLTPTLSTACGADIPASTSSVTVSSGSRNRNVHVYQTKAHSSNWTGQLLSFSVEPRTGEPGKAQWDARKKLPEADQRQIVTVNTGATPVPFNWASLDVVRKRQLDNDDSLVNYLRGDATHEGARFRQRQDDDGPNKLGDIVSSVPVFVGAPAFRYSGNMEPAYSSFVAAHSEREQMVYVGANDGMLHAFNASTGAEAFAFIPGPVFPQLRELASKAYSHQFFVDGSPSAGDAFFEGAWRTVLVGGLNKGGQGIYALDISDPKTFLTAEANPGKLVLWEFTDADDGDLGFTHSQPVIAKLRNGDWAVIFGNGYGSRAGDAHRSTTGTAVLYIVDIANGKLIRKIDTGAGVTQPPADIGRENGLSTPALTDMNGDRIVEYAYAGDVYGNLWKFDLSSPNSAEWNVAFGGAPLFQARSASGNAQPITVRPEVGRGPHGIGAIVLFGAGANSALMTAKSPASLNSQTFYGVVDRSSGPVVGRRKLQSQQITHEFPMNSANNAPPYSGRITTANPLGENSGWYMDLASPVSASQSEQLMANPVIRDGRVLFTTRVSDNDPCGSGSNRWTMSLNMLDGARPESTHPAFDINQDNKVDASDTMIPGGNDVATSLVISGISSSSDQQVVQSPAIIEGKSSAGTCVQHIYSPGPSGSIVRISASCSPHAPGRQTWRQIR